jgi:hypothetical protein
MRCTNWQLVSFAAALAFGVHGRAAAADVNPPKHVAIIDDANVIDDYASDDKTLLGSFDYLGRWQHVRGRFDGRSNGTSTRSTRRGDVAILSFNGTRIRIFGVRGPSGGRARVGLDQASTRGPRVDFYAAQLEPHALVYESPVLPAGMHTLTIVVLGTRDVGGRYYYVNIDDAEVES